MGGPGGSHQPEIGLTGQGYPVEGAARGGPIDLGFYV